MDRAAADRYFAPRCIDCDAIAIDIHIRQAFDLDFTILDTGQDPRIIETRIYIFWIQTNAPCRAIRTFDIQIPIQCDFIRPCRCITGFSPAICLLDSDAIAAIATGHSNVRRRCMDRNAAGSTGRRIKPDAIRKRIATGHARCDGVQLTRRDSHIFLVSRIDAGRTADRMRRLKLEGVAACIDGHIIARVSIYRSQYIGCQIAG